MPTLPLKYATPPVGAVAGGVSDDIERVLGRPARGVETFLADHAAAFGG